MSRDAMNSADNNVVIIKISKEDARELLAEDRRIYKRRIQENKYAKANVAFGHSYIAPTL